MSVGIETFRILNRSDFGHKTQLLPCYLLECCLTYFITSLFGLLPLPVQNIELKAGVTGLKGMRTPPRNLIPPLVFLGVRSCPALNFVFLYDLRD